MIGGGSKEPGGPEAYPTEDPVYQGFLEMDGGRVEAALELIHEGRRRVRGALQGASGLMADGEGVLRGETLSLLLTYGGTCPGRMELEGVWDREARVFAGAVEASDCTGPGQGTFHFSAGNRPGFSSLARR
ncbi:MAG: hypothetical protein KJN92_05500 [Gemmatimonadetes bacterium]|nr:hypothetical protein [Gemmatimonadota bacterium]